MSGGLAGVASGVLLAGAKRDLKPVAGNANNHSVINAAHCGQAANVQVWGAVFENPHADAVDFAFDRNLQIEAELLGGGGGSSEITHFFMSFQWVEVVLNLGRHGLLDV